MVGAIRLLFQQDFTNTSTIPVEHGANSSIVQVRVVTVSGTTRDPRADLVTEITPDASDPLNKLTVTLSSVETGTVQIFRPDTATSPFLSTADKLKVGKNLVGSDGITVVSGSTEDTVQGFKTEFVAASGSLQGQIDTLGGSGIVGMYYNADFTSPGSASNKWMARDGKDPLSNETPFVMLFDSRIVGLSYSNKNDDTQGNIELHVAPLASGTNTSIIYTWSLSTNTRVATNTGLPSNLNLNAGDKLGIYIDGTGGGAPTSVVVSVGIVITGDAEQELSENYGGSFS